MSELERICAELGASLGQIGPLREQLLDAALRMGRLADEVHGMVDASERAAAQRIAAHLREGAKRCTAAASALEQAEEKGGEWISRSCGGGGGSAPAMFTAGGPRVRDGKDIDVDADGYVDPPSSQALGELDVQGLSVYDSVENLRNAGLSGQVRTPATPLPDGLGMIADHVGVGGPMPAGHHTVYPARRMPFAEFDSLIKTMSWHNIGVKLPKVEK